MKKDKHLTPSSKGKMSSSLSETNLEKRFQTATNTQDSIQTLSLWLLHHKVHHQKIVGSWMKVLQKAKISHRLTLFYLANDVVQNSKRKNFLQFVNSFAEVLREATLLVRNDAIRPNIQRVFTIWEQRNVYSPEFIADLRAILSNTKVPATAPSKLLAQFKPEAVIDKMRVVSKLDVEVNTKLSNINLNKLKATDAEIIQQYKDRTHGQQFKKEFDESARRLEELIKIMEKEMVERTELILLLEQSEIYYDTQKGEAKIVANAYKNFGSRIEKLQKKLEELVTTFPSPIPSPSVDAPSPTTSDHELELNLPADNPQEKELENLENAPSPEGTPEGLNLPEDEDGPTEGGPKQPPPMEKEVKKAESEPAVSVGNPIPTLSNFFTHEEKGMTSWLGAFANKKKEPPKILNDKPEIQNSDGGSLESRLSNLIQNMPSLPSGLQNTIFGSNASPKMSSVESSPSAKKLESNILTPGKEDYSGQNTPLQDEDTHSSHAFFSKLASSNKTHSPKDILKGLTNLIQSASAEKEENQKRDKFPSFEPQSGMSTFIKSIIPSGNKSPQRTSSSSTFFNASQSERTAPLKMTPSGNSFQSTSSMSAYSSSSNESRSFIPSLVPSMPQDDFESFKFPADEYNPELETFDTDMDIDNEDANSIADDVPSPAREELSPVIPEEPVRPAPARRLSTLITLVADEPPATESLPTNNFTSANKENNYPGMSNTWPDTSNHPIPTPASEVAPVTSPNYNSWGDPLFHQVKPPVSEVAAVTSPNYSAWVDPIKPPVSDIGMPIPPNNYNAWLEPPPINPPVSEVGTVIPPRNYSTWLDSTKPPVSEIATVVSSNNYSTWVDQPSQYAKPPVSEVAPVISSSNYSSWADLPNQPVKPPLPEVVPAVISPNNYSTWCDPPLKPPPVSEVVPPNNYNNWMDSAGCPSAPLPEVPVVNSPSEEYFMGKPTEPPPTTNFYNSAPPPPMPPIMSPPSGQSNNFGNSEMPQDMPHSRIETLDSHRDDANGRWFNNNNNYNDFDDRRNRFPRPPGPPPNGPRFDNNRQNFRPRHFSPRQNWNNQNRPFHQKHDHNFAPRPYGRPPFRGRGGFTRHPQY